ncbi:ATPase, T2SS/T4P/T4SS family [Catellatospora sp. KI3]|uniref:CpaF family protein n=1 Tax=Catellatospora sp. KI3 TaxID=3041620 RepID=UPI00248239A0|nr:ATPase, T2SS/T4P/T4SS family [Catellatospora sp. KI3]MDI1461032.1 ATPase, T2SS/T4P/T4SS family [Catellatospora sp. KI3]
MAHPARELTTTDTASDAAGDSAQLRLAQQLRERVRSRLVELDGLPAEQWAAQLGRLLDAVIDDLNADAFEQGMALAPASVIAAAKAQAIRLLTPAGGLQLLLDDPRITNIFVNSAEQVWVRYTDGTKAQAPPVAASDAELIEMIRLLAAGRDGTGEERRFDFGQPRLSLQLPDGARLFAVQALARRPSLSIRRHQLLRVTLDDLVARGTLTVPLARLLAAIVAARRNVVIAGGTDSGKTTLLRAMAKAIPSRERIITIEDTYELGLDFDPDHPDCVALQAREANLEGEGAVDQAELVRWALRMAPDRVIVGEARGSEVLPLLNAMSQGNDGSLATIHASSSAQAITRLMTYAAQAPERLSFESTAILTAGAVHFIVHLAFAPDGTRVVSSVREVLHADGRDVYTNEVYAPGPDRRAVAAAPLRAETAADLIAAGLDPGVLDTSGRW